MRPAKLFSGLLLVMAGICAAKAQQSEVDSLLIALQKHPQQDTIRFKILNGLSFAYCTLDPSKGLTTSDQAITLAKRLKLPIKLATAYSNKAYAYSRLGQDSLALALYKQALAIHQAANNLAGVAKVFQGMGMTYFNLGNYSKALEAHQQAARISEKQKNIGRQAIALNSVAINYMYLGNYPKALQMHLHVLQLHEKLNDSVMIATSLSNIGLVYGRLSNYSKALSYQKRALSIYQVVDYPSGLANTISNIATLYDNLHQPDTAVRYYQESLKINQSIQSNRGIASDLINIGIVYNDQGKYAEALSYLQKGTTLYKTMGDQANLAVAFTNLSDLYLRAPESLLRKHHINPGQRFTIALSYQQQALKLAQEAQDLDTQRDVWQSLSEIYKTQGKYAQSLSAYKQHVALRDSLVNEDKKIDVTRQEMQFEQEKREAVMTAQHTAALQQEQFERNIIIGGSGVLLLAGSIGFLLFKRRREADQKRKEAELKAEITDTEMKALRAQMNPHFIFNSLNSISDYVHKHDTVLADYYLTKFAKLMRLILENSEQNEVPLTDDMQALELYMQLEAMRLPKGFTYSIQIDEAIDPDETFVPPLLLQPFVENSIWHGLAYKPDTGHISVRIQKEGDMLTCIVEDNGVGRQRTAAQEKTQTDEKKSLGMKITNSRIALLNQRKQARAAVTLHDLPEGMRIAVKLPLELNS